MADHPATTVLLISREYPPFIGGGIGTYTVRMARALAARGHEPVVVTVGDTDTPIVEEDGGVRVVRLPFLDHVDGQPDWSAPRGSILASPTGPACHAAFWAFHRESVLAMQLREHLPWLLETFEPAFIEAPDTGALLWFILNERRLGRGPLAEMGADGPPVVVHLHSPTAWIEELQGGPQMGRAMAELRSMERDVLRWADGVACPSRALARWIRGFEPGIGEISVTPYPLGGHVDVDAAMPDEPAVLFVGRLERRKGFDTLAKAMGVLGGDAPPLRVAGRDTFDWVGDELFGSMAVQRHCPSADIQMLGELVPEDLEAQRARCSMAVVPSPDDNYPNTCMEAMAAGQVTIAARAGGMAEMIEDGVSGLLFEPGDAQDLARVLGAAGAMSTDQRRAMGRAARERISTICDDRAVVAARLEHALAISPLRRRTQEDREVALVAFAPVDDQLNDALTGALRANTEADAVAPWFARVGPDGHEVVPFSTPSADCPALLVEHPGPLAVDAAWWRRLEKEGVQGGAAAMLLALVQRGARVAALPEVVAPAALTRREDLPGTPLPQRLTDAERAITHKHTRLRAMLHRAQTAEMERDAAVARLTQMERDAATVRVAHTERDAATAQLAQIRASRAYRLVRAIDRIRRRVLGGAVGSGRE